MNKALPASPYMTGKSRRALIFGITGQDGAYLAADLLQHGYEVYGATRQSHAGLENLRRLGIMERVCVHAVDMQDFGAVSSAIQAISFDEIYNLAGQSSVGLSFAQPVEAFASHALGTLNILEAIRSLRSSARLYNASSAECFGDSGSAPLNEDMPFRPITPYGVAKTAATMLVRNYREAFGLFACSGIMFNHESPLRPKGFVVPSVVHGAIAIARKQEERLQLGNITVVRDWGWAPDFVVSMRMMLQRDTAEDFVIATGIGTSLADFVDRVFRRLGLNRKNHVTSNDALIRSTEIPVSIGNPERALQKLGWVARVRMPEIADRLVDAALECCGRQ